VLVDTEAARSVNSNGFVTRTCGLDIIKVNGASIFMGGKDAGFLVPVVRAVQAGVFLLTTRSLWKWTSLEVLKRNSWDLERQDKALLFVVPDGVIPCGTSVLFGLNVLAPQDVMGRTIGPMWDVHLSRNVVNLTGIEGHSVRSLIKFQTEARLTVPVKQWFAMSDEQSGSG
jgi:hypothetical protein